MITHILKFKLLWFVLACLIGTAALVSNAKAQSEEDAQLPRPILLTESQDSMEERMARKITLDVRDMNVVDVIKFLAQKGEFNVIVSPTVDGRSTVLLHNVAIKDAMDIVVISNKLAYHVDNDIVQIMSSAEYEAMYGKQFSDKTQVSIIRLQYAKPSYVLAALDNMKSSIGKIIIDEDTGSVVLVDTPQSIQLMKKAIEQIERPLETIVYNLKYARADVVAEKLRSRIDAKSVGSISADERSNQVYVRVFPGRHNEVEKIIASLDEPTKEVLIEARVLQIILKPNYDVGVDWVGQISSSGKNKLSFKNLNFNDASVATGDNLSSTYGRIAVGNISADDFALSLRALQSVSETKILSSPQILVTNNEEAKIHIGDSVPYVIATTVGTANPVTSEDVRFIDVGLKLNVIPTINDDGMVTMRLRPEISSVVAYITSREGGKGIPQVNKTEVETSVMVQDGQTIVMAGLRKEDKAHVKRGLPVLMNLPYIGNIFSRTSDTITSTEIVILITPHIVKGTDSYAKVVGNIKPAKTYTEGVQPKVSTKK